MKNRHINKNVKFTRKNNMLGNNIQILMNEKHMSVQELADKSGVSRQAMYNIINGKSIPRKDTLELIAEQLDVSSDLLKHGVRHYDYDLFMQLLERKFPYNMKSEEFNTDFEEYIKGGIFDEENPDLQGYLVYKFDIDPVDMFVKHLAPSDEKQSEIAKYFGYEVNDIFKKYGSFPIGSDPIGFKHVNVCGRDGFDDVEFQALFERLNSKNKKMVLNLCIDLLQIQDD